jgi:hypothetical protein
MLSGLTSITAVIFSENKFFTSSFKTVKLSIPLEELEEMW